MHRLVSPIQAAHALRTSEATIKRWCDRGLLATQRTAGGHRRLLVGEILQFARSNHAELVQPTAIGLPAGVGQSPDTLEAAANSFLQHLIAGREEECRRIALDLFLAGRTFATICDHILVLTFARIGDMWSEGNVEVYEEHRGSEFCQRLLTEWTNLLPPPPSDAPLAIGCTPMGDPYNIPCMAIRLALTESGWRAVALGRGVPFDAMHAAIQKLGPRLFWVSVSSVANSDQFVHDYNNFYDAARQQAVSVIVGGRALVSPLRRRMRFSAFGDNLQHLQEFVDTVSAACHRY